MTARPAPYFDHQIAAGSQLRGWMSAVREGGNSPSAARRLCAPLVALTSILVAALLGATPLHISGKGQS